MTSLSKANVLRRMEKMLVDGELRTSKATGDHYTWWDKLGTANGIGSGMTCGKCKAKIATDSTQVLVFLRDKEGDLRFRGLGKDGVYPCECVAKEPKAKRKAKRKATAKPASKPVATAKPKAEAKAVFEQIMEIVNKQGEASKDIARDFSDYKRSPDVEIDADNAAKQQWLRDELAKYED